VSRAGAKRERALHKAASRGEGLRPIEETTAGLNKAEQDHSPGAASAAADAEHEPENSDEGEPAPDDYLPSAELEQD
jgi:hypothetical protein